MSNDTIGKTIGVALALCIVCSVVVSTAAVMLKPAQIANKSLDFKRNILLAAGLLEDGKSVEEQFKQITTKLVDLDTGKFTEVEEGTDKYDQRKASKDPARSKELSGDEDIAKISSRADVAKVYLVEGANGVETVILPIKGYGLWSTLYGFLALGSDFNTVVGMGFYEHAETPGLGGEVDNPNWKGLFPGKKAYKADGTVGLTVKKGPATVGSEHEVDGLSGATLTGKGVDNLIKFWLGEQGFAGFLTNLKNGEA
ncbi:Na(+)-translocating NADH-quinone reductase subunit C [Pseudomaricurvus alkylphenolicus]|uniref:Na(+)-translocating NADH-quinone reductase subunit C n=1 Tax=Pseudomaricurvus alkylphenolicus TaxID=1306991 RepID=UPI001421C830|nr:Na(+)-translocating NADH-quinone reductase subunit C [Pseudomaricurvus alkylphenolicus]